MSDETTDLTRTPREGEGPPDAFDDPGIPPHVHRRADTDPAAAKVAERQAATLFGISALGTIAALVVYFAVPPGDTTASVRLSTLCLGLAIAFALLGIGTGAVHWARSLMADRELTEERHTVASDASTRTEAVQVLKDGVVDANVGRRGLLKGAAVSALALFPLAIAVPLVGSVGGDWNVSSVRHTLWRKGTRLATDPQGRPIKATDLSIGSVVHVIPTVSEEEKASADWLSEKSKAIVLVVRLDPADLKESSDRKSWSYDGIVAYSKVCTHVGCPVALYEHQTHHLLCPCHQSTFDIADGAKVIFGPAKRPLPQLPITVDDEGYLIAQSDFHEPIGPSFWERLK